MRTYLTLTILLVGMAMLAPDQADEYEIRIEGFAFDPDEITIASGDTVTWTNYDDSRHTVTEDDDAFDSDDLDQGDSFSWTFDVAGSYGYFCDRHDETMSGTVNVEETGEPVDTDDDGLTDEEEHELGTDPNDPDTDGDGLDDGEEVHDYGTEPLLWDSDEDGYGDGEEVHDYGTDPLDGEDYPEENGGGGDGFDFDPVFTELGMAMETLTNGELTTTAELEGEAANELRYGLWWLYEMMTGGEMDEANATINVTVVAAFIALMSEGEEEVDSGIQLNGVNGTIVPGIPSVSPMDALLGSLVENQNESITITMSQALCFDV